MVATFTELEQAKESIRRSVGLKLKVKWYFVAAGRMTECNRLSFGSIAVSVVELITITEHSFKASTSFVESILELISTE